jgi:broad specificity phosphatase PhoE
VPCASSSSLANDDNSNDNLLEAVDALDHDYFALRHGESLANVAGIIMADPSRACAAYGLSERGQQQAASAAADVRQVYSDPSNSYHCVVLLTSDLLRAQETATIVWEENADAQLLPVVQIHQQQVIRETRLRERGFGTWDGTSDDNYHKVWHDDAGDASHTKQGVEAVHQVMRRATECVLEWDRALTELYGKRCMVVLVAHGDVLQILQTAFEKMDGRLHRSLPHLATAQLRQLQLRTEEER